MEKYTFLERKFHEKSIWIARILAKTRIFEKSPFILKKVIFGPKFFLTRVRKIFLDKNHQKFAKAIWICVSRECFLTFFD